MRLLKAVAGHPVSVVMVYTGLVLFGITSLFKLNVELLPTINIPVASVITEYSAIPASEVEQLVTIHLENVLSSVKGVRKIYSVTKTGISSVSLKFDWGTDVEFSSLEIREKIDSIYPYLPHGVKKPVVLTEDISGSPVIILAVFPGQNTQSTRDIGQLVKKDLKTRLLQIPGVSELRMVGIDEPEVKVDIDAYKLYISNLSLDTINETIGSSIYEYPAGIIKEKEFEYLIKTSSGVKTLEDIRKIPLITNTGGTGLSIDDLAEIYIGTKKKTSFFHLNGRDAIGIFIKKTGSTGTLNAANNVLKSLETIKEIFRNDLTIEVIEDRSTDIRSSIKNLAWAMLLGISAALLVLFLFFNSPVIPLISITSVPVSIAGVFLFMYFTDISINIISLSGIAIGIGMIVDNSIVVLENLIKHETRKPEDIALHTLEMGSSTFGSTITTLLVFLPIVFIPGITGALFRELALTICFLIGISFLISMSLTPALYSLFFKTINLQKASRELKIFKRPYRRYLSYGLKNPYLILVLFLFMGTGLFFFLRLNKEIMPEIDSRKLEAELIFKPGMSIRSSSDSSLKIENILLSLPGVKAVYSEAGYDRYSLRDRAEPGRELNRVRAGIMLSRDSKISTNRAQEAIIRQLADSGNFSYSVKLPEDRVKKLLGSSDKISLLITGEERKRIIETATSIIGQVKAQNLIKEAMLDTSRNTPELLFEIERDSAVYSNLNVLNILETLRSAVRGTVTAKLRTDDEDLDIRVGFKKEYTDSIQALRQIKVPSPRGLVALADLGKIKRQFSFGELYRVGRKNGVEISFVPQAGKTDELIDFLSGIENEGCTLTAQSELESSLKEIGLVFLLAVLLIYLILGAQFESLKIPLLLLLLSLLASVSGALILLFLTGKSLNLNSFFGILILLGTAINGSIILSAGYGRGRPGDIIRGSAGRLKPILASVSTTIMALLPIAFNPFREGTLQSHIAVSVIGGLISGTVITLLIFPLLYYQVIGRGGKPAAVKE